MSKEVDAGDLKNQQTRAWVSREDNARKSRLASAALQARKQIEHDAMVNDPLYEDPIAKFRRVMGAGQ